MEIKGIISLGGTESLTCCENVQDILIGSESLFAKLEELFTLDAEKFFEDYDTPSPKYGLRYVILDEESKEEKTFEQQSAEVVIANICGSYVGGCYSEYTCGYGGFDYVNDESGHSIFKELEDKVGKYIHLKI